MATIGAGGHLTPELEDGRVQADKLRQAATAQTNEIPHAQSVPNPPATSEPPPGQPVPNLPATAEPLPSQSAPNPPPPGQPVPNPPATPNPPPGQSAPNPPPPSQPVLNPPATPSKPPPGPSTPIPPTPKSQPTQNDPGPSAKSYQGQDKNEDADMMDDEDDEDLPDITEEQRKRVLEILSTGPGKPKTVLGMPPGEYTASTIREAAYRQLVFIHRFNFKPPSNEKDDISELADQAVLRLLTAANELGMDQETLDTMDNYAGGTVEELLAMYGQHAEMETDGAYRPPQWVIEEYRRATPYVAALGQNPSDPGAKATLHHINAHIKQEILKRRDESRDNNVVLGNYEIRVNTIIEYLKTGNDSLARLNQNGQDLDAMAKLKEVNNYLNELNRKYYYPEDWNYKDTIDRIESTNAASSQVPKAPEKETPATNQNPNDSLPGFHNHSLQPGHVLYKKMNRSISGIFECGENKYGTTHQFLLERYSKNDRHVHDLVAASSFGKGAASKYRAKPDAVVYKKGKLDDLEGKNILNMDIGWVGHIPRSLKKRPKWGWTYPPRTVVAVAFGLDRSTIRAYTRSTLWAKFGKEEINRQIEEYSRAAGKKASWIKRGRRLQYVDSDNGEDEDEDEDEGYQSLGSQDTSDEEEEEEDDDVEEIPLAKSVKKTPHAKGVKETPAYWSRADEIERLLAEAKILQQIEDKAKRKTASQPYQRQERPRERSRRFWERERGVRAY